MLAPSLRVPHTFAVPLSEQLEPLHQFFMAVAFAFGATVGSFANVCIARWPLGQSVIHPPSRCPKCKTRIGWYDNIPIVSWLILRAKCRYCGLPIHWQYPLVEAITGALFLCVYLRFGITIATPIYCLFAAAMVIVTVQDLIDWTIPDEISIPGIPIGIAIGVLGWWQPDTGLRVTEIWDAVAGAALGGGVILAIDRFALLVYKKPGMGFGDVKLLAMIGAFLGWQGALGTLMAASWLALIIGAPVVYLAPLFSKAKPDEDDNASDDASATVESESLTDEPSPLAPAPEFNAEAEEKRLSEYESDDGITLEGHYLPFGPFLVGGALLYLFFGPEVLAWYLDNRGNIL